MLSMLVNFLVLSFAIYIIALIVPGVRLKGVKAAFSVAAVYGLLNFLLFKVMFFITFPLVFLKYLTLGIFGVILNAVLLMITDKVMDDFELSGFGPAVLAALGISGVNLLLGIILGLANI